MRTYSDLHRHSGYAGFVGKAASFIAEGHVATKGRRLGFAGDILWLHRHDLLDLLVLSSSVYAEYFGELGIPSMLVPRGYHSSYGSVLNLERDIAAVWMGKLRTKRRKRAIHLDTR